MSLKIASHTGGESARGNKDNWHWYRWEEKKTKGIAFGMTDFINPNDNNKSMSQLIKELTGGLLLWVHWGSSLDQWSPPSHKNGSYLNSNLHVPLTRAKLSQMC